MFKDLKKFQAELDRYHDVNYASKVAIDCAKAKGDLMSYKIKSEKSSNEYTRKINDLNQMILDMKKELFAHQETISIMSQEKKAQIKFYKTREDKELDKVIALKNKVKVLDDIVYKTGQSVQTMNMLNRNCKTSFAKPEFLKKAQRANPRLYDIGCYNDNLALMLAHESDETIRLDKESRSKLSDLIRPFGYDQLNNLYDLKDKNDKSFKENQSNVFLKEREQYFEIQDLKAQLQDKGIAIGELKKLIEKMKGKSVETKFAKSSFIRQPTAFKSQRQSVLGKPTIFSDFLEKKDFSKSKSVTKNNVSNDFSKPVTAQILPQNIKSILKNTNVIAPGMYKVHTDPNQTRTPQLPQDIRNFKFSNNKTFVTACNDSLNAKTSNVNFVCVTCGKCVLNANHDACISKLLKEVNSRAKIKSHKTRNSNKPVEQKSHTQQPGRQIFTGHRWVPTGKIFTSCTSKADSESTHGSKVDISKIHECKQTLDLSAGTSLTGHPKQRIDFSAGTSFNVKQENLRNKTVQASHYNVNKVPTANMIELESLFGPLFDEYFNGVNQVVSKSSAVTAADASVKRQQQPDSTSSTSTLATTVTADGNFDL
ncbi:hypothetical protein Tco_0564445 [Tanacetum coccineum]